jgi:hypothetical protein
MQRVNTVPGGRFEKATREILKIGHGAIVQDSAQDSPAFFAKSGTSHFSPVFDINFGRGADRTGTMAGFYRVEFQEWDGRKASREARETGMRRWYRILRGQIGWFNPELLWTRLREAAHARSVPGTGPLVEITPSPGSAVAATGSIRRQPS